MKTFIDAVLAFEANLEEIDEWVESWHGNANNTKQALHSYLGLTWDQYVRWVENPNELRHIFEEILKSNMKNAN